MFDKATMDQIIKGAILGALGEDNGKKILEDMVTRLISTKVNKQGDTSFTTYGGNPDTPLLDYILNREVRHVIEQAIREHIEGHIPFIKEAVSKAVVGTDAIPNAIAKMIDHQLRDGYLKIDVNFEKRD